MQILNKFNFGVSGIYSRNCSGYCSKGFGNKFPKHHFHYVRDSKLVGWLPDKSPGFIDITNDVMGTVIRIDMNSREPV